MWAGVISSLSNIVLTVVLVLTIGFIGIPLGTAISLYLSWFWFSKRIGKETGVSFKELFGAAILWPLLASIPGVATAICCDIISSDTSLFLPNLTAAMAGAVAVGFSYLLILRLTPFLDAFDIEFLEKTLHLGRVPGFKLWSRGIGRV